MRKKKNLVPCPPLVRGQFDGVSSNWGKTNFAFHEHLVRLGIMPQVSVVRNPVASTHEDVDGLFADLGTFLTPRTWYTLTGPGGVRDLILQCFQRRVRMP